MFSLAYTTPLTLRSQIVNINHLREQILCIPIPRELECTLAWQTTVDHIHGSLSLAGIRVHNTQIEEGRLPVILGYKKTLDVIGDTWVANPESVGLDSIETMIRSIHIGPFARHGRIFLTHQKSIRKLLEYLDSQEEEPVIQAGVALGYLSAGILPPEDSGLIPRLLSHLYLAKHGLDVRGLAAVVRVWAAHESSYRNALTGSAKHENLTEWLQFFADSLETEYKGVLHRLTSSKLESQTHGSKRLTDRQRLIIHFTDDPASSITNRSIQKRLRISQITASRELSRLTTLGFLRANGKGRSVSYTRI